MKDRTRRTEFWAGVRASLPLIIGAIPFGIIFGYILHSVWAPPAVGPYPLFTRRAARPKLRAAGRADRYYCTDGSHARRANPKGVNRQSLPCGHAFYGAHRLVQQQFDGDHCRRDGGFWHVPVGTGPFLAGVGQRLPATVGHGWNRHNRIRKIKPPLPGQVAVRFQQMIQLMIHQIIEP